MEKTDSLTENQVGLFMAGITFTLQELMLSIAGSDVELAKKIVLDKATELLSANTEDSMAKWEEMVERYRKWMYI